MKKLIAPIAVALGIALSPVAASAGTTTTASTPTTTAAPAAKATTTKKASTYEIIAGTYVHKTSADRRLAAIEKKGVTGLSVVRIGSKKNIRERVEERGLSRADAKAKVALLKKDGISARYIRS